MVTEGVVDDVGLCVDVGMQHRLSASLSLHRVLDPLDPLHQYWTSKKSHHKTPTNSMEENGKVDVHLPFLE
jgi:hypothetical protein